MNKSPNNAWHSKQFAVFSEQELSTTEPRISGTTRSQQRPPKLEYLDMQSVDIESASSHANMKGSGGRELKRCLFLIAELSAPTDQEIFFWCVKLHGLYLQTGHHIEINLLILI